MDRRLLLLVCAAVALLAWAASFVLTAPRPITMSEYDTAMDSDAHRALTDEIVRRASTFAEELLAERSCTSDVNATTEPCHELLVHGDLDVVISGGGFRGQYAGGVLSVLLELERAGVLTVNRWAGSSIGACTAAHFATGSSFRDFFRVPFGWAGVWRPRAFWRGGPVVKRMMERSLGPNAMELVSDGKLFVTLSTLAWPRPWRSLFIFKAHQVSRFRSREDLLSSLTASAGIPFLTAANGFVNAWRGHVAVDGGFTSNTPVFTDNKRDQLVINLGFLDYPHLFTFTPLDPEHHKLVRKGQDDILAFLRVPSAANATRLTNIDLRPSLMLLRTTSQHTLPSQIQPGSLALPGWAAPAAKFYSQVRRRVELDAVPWIRVVCVEGGFAMSLYRVFGAEALCDMETIRVLELLLATVLLGMVLSTPLQCLLLGRAIERHRRRRSGGSMPPTLALPAKRTPLLAAPI